MASSRRQYPFHLIEPKWQKTWDEQQAFRAFNPGDAVPAEHPFGIRHDLAGKVAQAQTLPPKFYILDMFPYPSGAGLHVGHPEGYTATDILARYRRALGLNVLHPMGWDSFGLPAEQYAVKTGQHPRKTTEENIANFTRQIKSLGFSYDWTRELATTDPDYFKWTQWIFLKLYNSWFNPETNKAEPIDIFEDIFSENPKQQHKWGNNRPLASFRMAWESTPVNERAQRARLFTDSQRLAYVSEQPVWWCEQLGTVLANEEVVDGKSEVGGFPVVRKPMRQWMLRITAYAERLIQDLDLIDWTDSLKEMQRNWIGRSEGAEVTFRADAPKRWGIKVFTTRPDTLFGATYLVLAPEHRMVAELTTAEQQSAVAKYKAEVSKKSDLERTELAKEKSGVFTGAFAINPVNNEKIPIWIADYVLANYGTGAIMAVPAHDTRDLEFAKKFNLQVIQVVSPNDPTIDWQGFTDAGMSVNSGFLTGKPTDVAKKEISQWLEEKGLGKRSINYKLRDWLFSRQRYWGEPFPIVWKKDADGNLYHEALPESALPVLPPSLTDYKPTATGEPPLARAKNWVNLSDGSVRETNTMPQWAGSCWYYLRYLDVRNVDNLVGKEAEQYWMKPTPLPQRILLRNNLQSKVGVDLYVGGTEHAVLHLLYARFWHKVLFDLELVSTPEPFYKLVNQGLILGEMEYYAFRSKEPIGTPDDAWVTLERVADIVESGQVLVGRDKNTGEALDGVKINVDEIEKEGPYFYLKNTSKLKIRVENRCQKMSKSRGNVVNPDDVLLEYGADAFRLYEMFMGPLQDTKPWNTKGVEGVYRFLGRVWRLFVDEQSETEFEQFETVSQESERMKLLDVIKLNTSIQDVTATAAQLKALHACIKKVTEDLEGMRFNTAISAMMVFVNEAITWETKPVAVLRDFLILLQPFAPHLAEELWQKLHAALVSQPASLPYAPWPKYDPALLVETEIEMPVSVNGKMRDVIKVPADADNATIEAAALASEKVQQFINGKPIKKVIIVPKKMINLIVG